MKNALWLVGGGIAMAASLLAVPAFSQSTCVNCGCKVSRVWGSDGTVTNPKTVSASCDDASAAGSAQFNGSSGGAKTYRLIADLKKQTNSGFEKAEVLMLNSSGVNQSGSGLDRDQLAGAGHRRDVIGPPVNAAITIATFRLLAGKGYGNSCNPTPQNPNPGACP
jgi:hypothetical protein